ncbi:MAG: cob(I)yrinic acid a,c-diamide adenosyltransferase [Candidatus Aenigmatarchaeota archaeon]|nr:cob(I)yrinic acid a,c-diamide adenosyltransferase [Candidatus Aenigmarchaeota archaeon]
MGSVYLYTGDGAGKTTAALGLAMRSLGWGHKVIIVQFMKGRKNIGEYRIAKKLGALYEIHQFGRRGWVNVYKPEKKDIELAYKGLRFTRDILAKRPPHLLILDEINLAVGAKLLKEQDVLDVLKNIPAKTTVVLTGRWATKALIKRADFVCEVRQIKRRGMSAVKGIAY